MTDKRHGGALLIQALEPTKLIGSMMSVVTETGEEWIHLVFFNERGVFESADDGRDTRLLLSRTLGIFLLGLLRVSLAQFAVLHVPSGSERGAETQAKSSVQPGEIRIEASRQALSVVWPSAVDGVQQKIVDGQVELRLSRVFGVDLERALLTSLAQTAAGAAVPRA